MCSKKGRKMRKMEVPTDSVPAFKLGDTAADIGGGGEGDKTKGERDTETEGGEAEGANFTLTRGSARKVCKERQK